MKTRIESVLSQRGVVLAETHARDHPEVRNFSYESPVDINIGGENVEELGVG